MSDTTTPTLNPVAVGSGEGQAYWWGASLAVIKATAEDTGGQMTIIEVTEPPGKRRPSTSITTRTRDSGCSRGT